MQVRYQIPLTEGQPGHLRGSEVSEFSSGFFPCFQPTDLQLGNKCKAGRALSHVPITVLVAPEVCFMCSGKLCASSVRLSPVRMETLHLCVDVCLWEVSTSLGFCCLKLTSVTGETMSCLILQVEMVDSFSAIRALHFLLQTCTTTQSPSWMRKVTVPWSCLF